jgi:hypothetical protein
MNDPTTRLYGMADPSNHDAPAPNGMRGEGAADVDGPAYHRTIEFADQPAIAVEEVSGVASVEASRPAPIAHEPVPALPPAPAIPPVPAIAPVSAFVTGAASPQAPDSLSPWPWIVVSLAVGFIAGKRLGGRAEADPAFAPAGAGAGIRQDLDQVLV